jgi:hypothetical protein
LVTEVLVSAIALFVKFPKSELARLKAAAAGGEDFTSILTAYGKEVADYHWSGYVLGTLLPYLQEKRQIDLMKSEHDDVANVLTEISGGTHFVLVPSQRTSYIDLLKPELFSEAELRDYFNAFNETHERDIGKAMQDGVVAFRQALSQLDEDSVVVFSIG